MPYSQGNNCPRFAREGRGLRAEGTRGREAVYILQRYTAVLAIRPSRVGDSACMRVMYTARGSSLH